jgi:hypothetical protein
MDKLKEIIRKVLKEDPRFFTTQKVGGDDEGRNAEWEVKYEPNMDKVYQEMLTLVKQLEDAAEFYKGDDNLRKVIALSKELRKRLHALKLKKGHLEEESATNVGGATATPGEGTGIATKQAFNKNKNAKGAKNKYYYKLGFKPVPDIKPKSYDKKQLWEDEPLNEVNEFQKKRLDSLDEIEKLMNDISPLISNAKNETIELYSGNAGSYDITQPIEMVKSYLLDIKTLLSEK